MRNAIIHSSGMYVPGKVIPNSYFDELLGENVSEWLADNVQIFERRWCNDNQSVADLCIEAAKAAMVNGSVRPEEVDLLIIATDTPEYISPSTASKVQHALGLKNSGTFDLNSACAGFVTALDVASKYILADKNYNTVMIIGAYAMSKYLDMTDKKTVTLFADGAGAMILKSETASSDKRGYLTSQLITQGQYSGYMGIYGGGTHHPLDVAAIENKDHLLKFVTKFPKELNPQMWSQMILTLCERLDISPLGVSQYLMTQININSIRETMDIIGVGYDKAKTVMHYYGYTGSACIPIAFSEALKEGRFKRGDTIIFVGSGGGLAFASAAFKY